MIPRVPQVTSIAAAYVQLFQPMFRHQFRINPF